MQVPIIRRNPRAAFALIDPLIGILAVATVMVGVLNFWRLAEYKCDKARIDARVTQILRRWLKIIHKMWMDRTPYNAELHHLNQVKHGSWVFQIKTVNCK